ncbi:MAG: metalloregulator ArsR/SmtB family transcription factor [Ktedonobacterales bacterium]
MQTTITPLKRSPHDESAAASQQHSRRSEVAPTEAIQRTNATEKLDTLARYLKALADPSRLRLLGALANGERSVEELAALLDLKAPTISHHLARLRELDLVRMRADGNTHLYALHQSGFEQLGKELATLSAPAQMAALARNEANTSDADPLAAFDAWERKVLRDFFAFSAGENNARLKEIPTTRKKRDVILKWLANRFAWDHTYSEAEVNAILKRHHPDVAYLRRDLVGLRLMRRENGQYWRSQPSTPEALAALASRFTWGRIYSEVEINELIGANARDVTALRQDLLAGQYLAGERDHYWLIRPPEEQLTDGTGDSRL